MLGVRAPRLQLDPVRADSVEALHRDVGLDPGDHDLAVGRVGRPPDRDDVARLVAHAGHAVAADRQVEVRVRVDQPRHVVGHPYDGLALVGEDRRPGGHLGQAVGVEHRRPFAEQLDAPVHPGVDRNPALLLERVQVVRHRRHGNELEAVPQVTP